MIIFIYYLAISFAQPSPQERLRMPKLRGPIVPERLPVRKSGERSPKSAHSVSPTLIVWFVGSNYWPSVGLNIQIANIKFEVSMVR